MALVIFQLNTPKATISIPSYSTTQVSPTVGSCHIFASDEAFILAQIIVLEMHNKVLSLGQNSII